MALGVSAGDYTAPLTTTWSVQGGSNAAGVSTDAETHYYNMWGTSGWVAQAYTLFSLKSLPADEVVTKATYSFYINCNSKTRAADVMVLPVGSDPADFQALKAKAACGTVVASFTDITTSYAQKTVDVTEQVKAAIENGDTCVIMVISNGQAGGYIYGKGSADYAPALAVTTASEDDLAAYQVKYVVGENEVKEAENLKGLKNAPITLKAEQKADFYNEDGTVKYIYVSDDAESKTVSDDGSTVVTVTYRLADTFSYIVNAVLGDYVMEVNNGQLFEGDSETVGYPRYVLNGADLYEIAQGNPYYAITVSPTVNNQEYDKTYTLKEANSNVVFYAEAEDIPNVTPFRDTYTEIRTSNAVVGVADSVAVATLIPGKYTLTSATRSGTTNFYVNGENILTMSSTGAYAESVSNEFIVKENDTEVYAKNVLNSGNTNYFDYVLIRRTGDYNYFEIETSLPDTITVTLGEVEDYAKLDLSDYINVKTNAEEYFPVINYAVAEEGVDKKDATYTAVLSEKPLYEVFTEPGTYYVFADVVSVFADETVDHVSTDTIVVVLKEKETEPAEEPGVKYSYTLSSEITEHGNYEVTGGSIDLLSGAIETKNGLYGQKSGATITAQVNMERKLKVNDCIKLTMFCSSSNKATGLDITKDGTTSLAYFPLPSGNNRANTYTVEYIVKESDVNLIGVDTFSIKKITATDNLYLTGVEVEVLEKKAPVFTVQPVGKNVASYVYVNIPVKATGFPEPTYQWYVNGEPVDYDSEYGIFIGEAKTYTVYVTATNSEGSVNSEEIELKAIDDVHLNGNKCVIPTDMEVADGLNFFADDCRVRLLDNGNFSVQAADAEEAPAGYSAIISGTVNPTVNDDNVTGVGYEVVPHKTGVFTFVGKFNPNKAINIMKFTYAVAAKAAAGSLQADAETVSFKVGETEYTSGSTFDETYNGPISFDVDDEHEYIIYATSSKIGMYGFDFTEATAVDGVSEAQESVKKEGKFIENGQIVILKAGKKFNAAGAQIK